MILFVQNLCSATREVLKCTTRYSSSFEEDGLLGLIRLVFRSPLDMLKGGLLSGGASPRAAYQNAPLSAARATQQPNVKCGAVGVPIFAPSVCLSSSCGEMCVRLFYQK